MTAFAVCPAEVLGAASAASRVALGAATNAASAAQSTVGIIAAAGDEVSEGIAALFGAHGRAFQAQSAQAAQSLDRFVGTLSRSAEAYVSAETASAGGLLAGLFEGPMGAVNAVFLKDTGRMLIGNGANGASGAYGAAGGAGGWLYGNGGAGGNSSAYGAVGGAGGAAGFFGGNGGSGGSGGAAGAGVTIAGAGGVGGAGGLFAGHGGAGGTGGAATAVDAIAGNGGAGGAGGLWFGQGGAGGTGGGASATAAVATAGAGGVGGAGGLLYGHGGVGGAGGQAAGTAGDGGCGGDGGVGGLWYGHGGDGGAAGNGGTNAMLPALGGAGGTGGIVYGEHGANGAFGTMAAGYNQTPSGTGSATLSQLSTSGTWIVNANGQVVQLHGFNEVDKLAPYEPAAIGFDNADAALLQSEGFNVVRLGVTWAGLEPTPGTISTAYLQSISQTVNILGQHNIYTILNVQQDGYSAGLGGEGAPAWATITGGAPNPILPFPLNEFLNPAQTHAWNSFWSNALAPNGVGLQDNYSWALENLAGHFHGNHDVAGIEIMNEPNPGSQMLPTVLGSHYFDTQSLTPFYNQAASAIRAVDPNTLIFFEPNVFSTEGLPVNLGTVNGPNTVLSFHDYTGPMAIQFAQQYATAHNIPAFLSELGDTPRQTGLLSISAMMNPADQNLMGWTNWAFTGLNDITTQPGTTLTEALVYNPFLPPTGTNINWPTLHTLASPFPQQISGTPGSWSFANGVFQFGYSPQRVDGGGFFGAGSQTTISLPSIEFPSGYHVSINGGRVDAGSTATELIIDSTGGPGLISVTVTPDS